MSSSRPFFSIIIPTYNRIKELDGCLQSLTNLDYPQNRFEVIVVDDGSSHSPAPAIESFSREINLSLIQQANTGPAAARNAGARQAKGEYLAFTDDDCRPCSDWLQTLAARLTVLPNCAVSGRRVNALKDNLSSRASQNITDVVYAHFNANDQDAQFVSTSNLAVAAEQFHTIGGFDEAFNTQGAEDRELGERWRQAGYRIIFAPEVLIYHEHALTVSSLWRQHFNFGRGAFRFHAKRTQYGLAGLKPDFRFYSRLLYSPFLKLPFLNALGLMILIIFAQFANAAGYFTEKLST